MNNELGARTLNSSYQVILEVVSRVKVAVHHFHPLQPFQVFVVVRGEKLYLLPP